MRVTGLSADRPRGLRIAIGPRPNIAILIQSSGQCKSPWTVKSVLGMCLRVFYNFVEPISLLNRSPLSMLG